MNAKGDESDFLKAVEPILQKFIENIDSPFVWTPLGLFILCVLGYVATRFKAFLYLALAFLILVFGADWVGRIQNRQTPPMPNPQTVSYREDTFRYLSDVQLKAVTMLEEGKKDAAAALIDQNLRFVDEALRQFPNDADFHALMGYTLKDMYQSSKNLLPMEKRREYLNRAKRSFEYALKLDPNNPSAHNGLGNVLFFEGKFDKAIKEHEIALRLTSGRYEAAAHDLDIVIRVKKGEIPFDF